MGARLVTLSAGGASGAKPVDDAPVEIAKTATIKR